MESKEEIKKKMANTITAGYFDTYPAMALAVIASEAVLVLVDIRDQLVKMHKEPEHWKGY